MNEPVYTTKTPAQPPAPHWAEWLLVGLEVILLGALLYRLEHPLFMKGQRLPSLVLGLAPGSAWCILRHPSLPAHRIGIAVGLITFMFTNGTLSLERLGQVRLHPEYYIPALLLILVQPVLGALRWWLLLRAHGLKLTMVESLRLTLVGYFFNVFVPGATGGDLFRVYYVARGRGDTHGALTSVVFDRLLGLPPLILIILAAGLWNWTFIAATPRLHNLCWLLGLITLGSLVLSILAFAKGSALLRLLSGWAPRLPGGKSLVSLLRAVASYRNQGRTVCYAFLIGLVAHVFTIVAAILFGAAAGVQNIPAPFYFLLAPIGLGINAIPGAPGGLGQGEMAFANVFMLAAPVAGNDVAGALIMLCIRFGFIACGFFGALVYALGHHALPRVAALEGELS